MCGIAATLLYPQKRSTKVWGEIKETFTQNLLFNEERGQEATGLAILRTNGALLIYKMPLPAGQFVTTAEYNLLLDSLDGQVTLLVGHARRPTKGDPADLANDHPLHVGPIIGVHNGHIDNDEALFTELDFPRQAQVDSEIIFHLLAANPPLMINASYLRRIRAGLRRLQGKFTFLAGDQRTPHRLLVVKHQNPLSLHYHAAWQALIFSSRYIFLRKSFGPVVINEQLPGDALHLFDATALPALASRAPESVALTA